MMASLDNKKSSLLDTAIVGRLLTTSEQSQVAWLLEGWHMQAEGRKSVWWTATHTALFLGMSQLGMWSCHLQGGFLGLVCWSSKRNSIAKFWNLRKCPSRDKEAAACIHSRLLLNCKKMKQLDNQLTLNQLQQAEGILGSLQMTWIRQRISPICGVQKSWSLQVGSRAVVAEVGTEPLPPARGTWLPSWLQQQHPGCSWEVRTCELFASLSSQRSKCIKLMETVYYEMLCIDWKLFLHKNKLFMWFPMNFLKFLRICFKAFLMF